MQQYLIVILSVCVVVAYYCINYSSFLASTSSVEIHKKKQLRPLIFDYVYNSNSTNEVAPEKIAMVENVQGSLPYPNIRRDNGRLAHQSLSTKELGSIDNCNMEGTRIKHVIPSSAASLTWQDDQDAWMVWNDRGNSNPEIDTDKFQYVVVKDTIGGNETITKVDNAVATGNDESTTQGEWLGQDPRVILYNGKRIIIYHSRVQRQMWLYDHETRQTVMLTICGHRTDGIQKNWSPIEISDNILLLVYTIDPLIILRYDINRGDGVCTVVFGHLPLRNGMDEPYGGTPFVEITQEKQSKDRVEARSFLSIGHSRKANDLISPERQNAHRVYRPVPILLHMFCLRSHDSKISSNMQGPDSLEGCTFATDVYELWHEIDSPEFLLKTKWKKTERKARSVSFPYDLHIFRQENVVRVGIEYEDCFSAYEDYDIDLNSILNQQLTHPIRVSLEKQYTDDIPHNNDISPTLIQSSSTECPSEYSHAGDQKLYATPIANEDDLARRIDGEVWIVSHQYRRRTNRRKKALDSIVSPKRIGRKEEQLDGSQLDGILDHYPYPLQTVEEDGTIYAPKLCIYMYGSIYESILSDLHDNGNLDTTKIIHNDKTYPSFSSLEQLLSHPDDDPTGTRHQFENFLTATNLSYPVIMVRDDALETEDGVQKLSELVSKLGFGGDISSILAKKGLNKHKIPLDSISDAELRKSFVERFSSLAGLFESQPSIRLLLPPKDSMPTMNFDSSRT